MSSDHIEELITLLNIQPNTTRKAANRKLKRRKLFVCLVCFERYNKKFQFFSHLHDTDHYVDCKRISEQYKAANELYQKDTNSTNGENRVKALVQVACLVVRRKSNVSK